MYRPVIVSSRTPLLFRGVSRLTTIITTIEMMSAGKLKCTGNFATH